MFVFDFEGELSVDAENLFEFVIPKISAKDVEDNVSSASKLVTTDETTSS